MAPIPTREEQIPGVASLFFGALRALIPTLVIGILLLLIAAAIAFAQPDPNVLQTPLAILSAGVTCLIGGILTARINKRLPLLSGLCGGILLTGVFMLLSLCFFRDSGSGYSSTISLILHVGVIILECIGALIGYPRTKKQSSRKNRPNYRRR